MKTRKTWKQRIGKRMTKHIKETTQGGTLYEFRSNLKWQVTSDQPCYECRQIARKLGIEATA
jgi:hypothetical protein